VAGLLLAAGGLVGEFDKPRYVAFRPELCVHSRNRRTGCTRCLDQCPTGAITPAGNTVAIDPYVCAGCGSCSAVCPTGAATYAAPTPNAVLERLRALLGGYLDAGGTDPVLLLYEARHGDDLVDWSARAGRGLPARVLPFAATELGQLGLEALAGGFAYGAASVVVLVPPRKEGELGGLRANLGYLAAVLDGQGYGAERLVEVSTEDPDELEAALWSLERHAPPVPAAYLPMGNKRALARLALDHLHAKAPAPAGVVPLAAGAPFGTLRIDVEGCTLCLACVQVCPTGALLDNPERPTLRFLEDACVQCGLCQNTCPERVITLARSSRSCPRRRARAR
jgi:ferredoxin